MMRFLAPLKMCRVNYSQNVQFIYKMTKLSEFIYCFSPQKKLDFFDNFGMT